MGVTGDTATGAVKNALIIAAVQKELISKAVLAPTITDVSGFAGKGMNTISFPKAGSFTVENRASAVAATPQHLTFAKDTMALNFRATVAYLVDSMDELQAAPAIQAKYAVSAAAAHAVYVEQKIIAELELRAAATATVAPSITRDVILEMRQKLITQKADKGQLTLAIGPDQETAMLKIDGFVNAYQYGQSNIPNGVIGKVYGVDVLVSTEIGVNTYYMYEKSGCAIGFQRAPQMGSRPAPEYGVGSELVVLDQLFGVQGVQLGMQGVGAAVSALIVKDGN